MSLAIRVMVHPTEAKSPHMLKCVLIGEDGGEVGGFEAEFAINEVGDVRPGEEFSMAVALPLPQTMLPGPGVYSFEVLIDGVHQASVPFAADLMTQDPLPL